jgi:flagellar motor switch protein FliM
VPPTPLSFGRAAGQARFGGLVTDARPTAPYDFLRPSNLPREHLRTMQLTGETFARRLSVLLTSRLRLMCRVEPTSVKQVSVAEHVEGLTDSLVLAPLSLEPLEGTAAIALPLTTAMTCLDHMLGGSGGVEQPERQLSEIEAPLLRDLLSEVLAEIRDALEEVVRIDPVLGPLEYNPQLIEFGGPSEALLVATYDLTIGETTSALSVALPLQSLLPALQRFHEQTAMGAGERAARQAARDLLTNRLREVPVDVTVVFAPIRLRSDQLLDLRPGDVVPLDHAVDMPLDITTAGEVFGRAVATKRGHRLACQVVATDDATQD